MTDMRYTLQNQVREARAAEGNLRDRAWEGGGVMKKSIKIEHDSCASSTGPQKSSENVNLMHSTNAFSRQFPKVVCKAQLS